MISDGKLNNWITRLVDNEIDKLMGLRVEGLK